MTKSHLKSVFAAVAASLMLSISGIFGVSPAFAAESQDFPVYLLVSPASQTLGKLEPGKSYSGEFLVKNIGTDTFDYTVYAAPYSVEDEEYNSNFEKTNNYTFISEWFTFSKDEGTLSPQQEEKIQYTVKVPESAAGGAQNAAIMVQSDTSAKDSNIVLASSRVAMIVFSQINGEVNACGKIVDKTVPSLLLNPPISASGRVENCGNIDLNVRYVMEVTPLFSNEPIYSNEDEPLVLATLPETRRFTSIEWENTPAIGIYKVHLTITYNDQTEEVTKIVLVCPLWVIVLVLVFIGALIFWLVSRNRNRKAAKKAATEE
ncbi:LapA family protein [Candidatus Saccharibacteria bacterium]|nr:LapA family protein [Candidatus Saccharibacteria bacterium]